MFDIYLIFTYVSDWFKKYRKGIGDQLSNLGVGAYVTAFIEIVKGNFALNIFLLLVIGVVFTFLAYRLTDK